MPEKSLFYGTSLVAASENGCRISKKLHRTTDSTECVNCKIMATFCIKVCYDTFLKKLDEFNHFRFAWRDFKTK